MRVNVNESRAVSSVAMLTEHGCGTDDHALAMVRSGVHLDLVAPLKTDSVQLQMAALSLLRNLCLPSANKATLLEAGMLDHLLQLSVAEQPALFKVSPRTDVGTVCSRD